MKAKEDLIDMNKYTNRSVDKMFLADMKIYHEDMIAFGKGWRKGYVMGALCGILGFIGGHIVFEIVIGAWK